MEGNRKELNNESQKINFLTTRNETSKSCKELSFAWGGRGVVQSQCRLRSSQETINAQFMPRSADIIDNTDRLKAFKA